MREILEKNFLETLDQNANQVKKNEKPEKRFSVRKTTKEEINQKLIEHLAKLNLPKAKTDITKIYAEVNHPTLREIGKPAEKPFYYIKLQSPSGKQIQTIKKIIDQEDGKHLKKGRADLDRISVKGKEYTITHPNQKTIQRIIQIFGKIR